MKPKSSMVEPPKYFLRPFPSPSWDNDNYKMVESANIFYVRASHYKHHRDIFLRYNPHGIFYNKSQGEVYGAVVESPLELCLENKHDLVILSVGPKCTGKTYSMMELKEPELRQGIVPRLLSDLFKWKKSLADKELKVKFSLSCVENRDTRNSFYDLLLEPKSRVTYARHVTTIRIPDYHSGLRQLIHTFPEKEVEEKSKSSRIITFYIQEYVPYIEEATEFKIHCIDAASLDPINNRSLNYNITSLVTNFYTGDETREPFLMHYFGKDTKHYQLIVLAHLDVQKHGLDDTLSTLRLASHSGGVKARPQSSMQDDAIIIRHLEHTLKSLRAEATLRDNLNDGRLVPDPTPKTNEDIEDIRWHAYDFFHKVIPKLNYTDIESFGIIMEYFKRLYLDLTENRERYFEIRKYQVMFKCRYGCEMPDVEKKKKKKRRRTKKRRKSGEDKTEDEDQEKDAKPKKEDKENKKEKEKKGSKKRESKPPIPLSPKEKVARDAEKRAAKEIPKQIRTDRMFEKFLDTSEQAHSKFLQYEELQAELVDLENELRQLSDDYFKIQIYSEKNLLDLQVNLDMAETMINRRMARKELIDADRNEGDEKEGDDRLALPKSSSGIYYLEERDVANKDIIQAILKTDMKLKNRQARLRQQMKTLKEQAIGKWTDLGS